MKRLKIVMICGNTRMMRMALVNPKSRSLPSWRARWDRPAAKSVVRWRGGTARGWRVLRKGANDQRLSVKILFFPNYLSQFSERNILYYTRQLNSFDFGSHKDGQILPKIIRVPTGFLKILSMQEISIFIFRRPEVSIMSFRRFTLIVQVYNTTNTL